MKISSIISIIIVMALFIGFIISLVHMSRQVYAEMYAYCEEHGFPGLMRRADGMKCCPPDGDANDPGCVWIKND